MSEKQKLKNDQVLIHHIWDSFTTNFRHLQIVSTPLLTVFLFTIVILLHSLENFGSVHWVYSLPQRIIVYVILILIACVLYILGKSQSHSAPEFVTRFIPLHTKLMWFVSAMLICYFMFSIYFYTFPLGYAELLKVENNGFHSYSLQHTAGDYAESYTHYYKVFVCYFDLFCNEIYSRPKDGLLSTTSIDSINFEIVDNQLIIYQNGEIALSY